MCVKVRVREYSSIQFNSLLQLQLFTVFHVIYVIGILERINYFFIKLFMIAFSLICMSCGNREGISGMPCSPFEYVYVCT